MFVGKDYDNQNHKDDSGVPLDGRCKPGKKCNPHGTTMLGMVAGAKLGIAKKVKPVLVRVPRRSEFGGGASPMDYLEGVSLVNDAFNGKSKETKAILSLSWCYTLALYTGGVQNTLAQSGFEIWKIRLYRLITSLIEKGVFVVTGSGNSGVVCCDHTKIEIPRSWSNVSL